MVLDNFQLSLSRNQTNEINIAYRDALNSLVYEA